MKLFTTVACAALALTAAPIHAQHDSHASAGASGPAMQMHNDMMKGAK